MRLETPRHHPRCPLHCGNCPQTISCTEIAVKPSLASILILIQPLSLPAADWPTWRGPTGLGVSEEKELPVHWTTTQHVKWKVKLPSAGNSTPVIWGQHVFITQANDVTKWPPKVPKNFAGGSSAGGHALAEKRSVMCLDRTTGKL